MAGPVLQNIENDILVEALREALGKLDSTGSEMVLDFSSIQRVGPAGLQMLDNLARQAQERSVDLTLRGVNVDVYKVLKLARLSSRLSFVD